MSGWLGGCGFDEIIWPFVNFRIWIVMLESETYKIIDSLVGLNNFGCLRSDND
jgi:hypothetical protein